MIKARLFHIALPLALFGTSVAACVIDRETDRDGGVHPDAFIDEKSPEFHGKYLRSHDFPLEDCRQCHGDDYAGGGVGVSCNQAGCHTKGVEWCGTCHEGGNAPPKPTSGGHGAHKFDCSDCHDVPTNARADHHPDGETLVEVQGFGASHGAKPVWKANERLCTNTYCHGPKSPIWETPPGPLPCDACHAAPPDSHVRFTDAVPPDGCVQCHPGADDPRHLNGTLEFLDPGCGGCHGKTPTGMPPPALDGSTSPSSRGVGAHVRHTSDGLLDRIGRTAECTDCHVVPASTLAEGHLDTSAPADVVLFGGTYDAVTGSCVVGCHFDKDPGPVWTDTSGAPRKCDGCHGFPPIAAKAGTPHPVVEAKVEVCQDCHHFEVATHVDGKVDFLP